MLYTSNSTRSIAALWSGLVAATFALRNHHCAVSRGSDDVFLPTQNAASLGKSICGNLPDLFGVKESGKNCIP